ncbi:hypothetical protein EfmGK961_14620 [Enterococcus faecium]|nr:hypothetical protein EfmGK961_14620 [Enterococcus faecium]
MEEKNLTVIGSYSTREEALSVIERLRNEGYERDDIVILPNSLTISSNGEKLTEGFVIHKTLAPFV